MVRLWYESELVNSNLRDFFNLEGDYIAKEAEELLFCERLCSGGKHYVFVVLKKTYKPDVIREIYYGLKYC